MKKSSKKSIKQLLLFYFCVLIFSSVAFLMIILSASTSRIVLEYTEEEISNGLKQVEKSVDDRLLHSIECFSSIILDDDITHTLKTFIDIDTSEGFGRASEVSGTLRLLKQSYPYVSAIYIYDVNNQCYYHSENTVINEFTFENTDLYKKFIEKEEYYSWKATKTVPGMSWAGEKGYVTCALPMKENIGKEVLGYVFISLDVGEVFKYIEDYEIIDSEELFWFTSDNQLLASSEELPDKAAEAVKEHNSGSPKNSIYLGGLSKYLYVKDSEATGMKYCVLIPNKNVKASLYKIWRIAFLCMIPILGMAFYLSYIFTKRMYRPMDILVEHMKKAVIVGGNRTLISEVRTDEFGVLYSSFNQMLIENGSLLDKLTEEQEKQRMIQLRLFQEQINPHFLYNTLNSIYCLSNLHGMKEIADLAKALINFYRLSLNNGQDEITIRNTISHNEYYVRIQNVRYRGKYRLKIHAEEELMDIFIPKLIVQPLVENSIEHGLKDAKYESDIDLYFVKQEDTLIIIVSDFGCGISPPRLKEIQDILSGCIDDDGQIFALKNINDRLKLYYGESSKLEIRSVMDAGVTVEIRIPLSKGEDENV